MDTLKSKDYDNFAFVKGNRELYSGKKYRTLKNSIDEAGYLISPIVVIPNDDLGKLMDLKGEELHGNSKPDYIVIDGQHRLAICKELEMEITVFVNEEASRLDIISANNTGNRWGLPNYVKSYADDGNMEYAQLQMMIAVHKENNFTISAVIESYAKGTGGNKKVIAGDFELDMMEGQWILNNALALKPVMGLNKYKELRVIRAFKNLYRRYRDFDSSIVVSELQKTGETLELVATPAKDSRVLLDIYGRHFKIIEGHDIPSKMREFIIAYHAGQCAEVGCDRPGSHIDHVKAYANGGETKISNLRLLCAPCNQSKGAKEIND